MSRLRAAAGMVDLQPMVGSPLTGFGNRLEPSVGVHDSLMAKLLLLDDGSQRLLWVSCELIGFSPEHDAQLRRLIGQRLGLPTGNVFVSCTHTHSGPCSMPFRGALGCVDESWLGQRFDAIAREAEALVPRLRPARLAFATEEVMGLGYNRQDRVSPIDQRLLVAQVSDDDGSVIVTILNCATHPVVLGSKNLLFSGDYPGYATRFVERSIGGVALFVLGSAGDVDPVVYRDLGRSAGTFAIAQQMGQSLAEAAIRAIARAEGRTDVRLSVADVYVELPLQSPPSQQELASIRADLLKRRGPLDASPGSDDAKYATFELAWVEELQRALAHGSVPRTLPVQLFAASAGELSIVTFPAEIYSQIGLDVRSHLAPRPVIIAGYTNGLLGYAPTDLAIDQGGYGPALSYRFFPHLLTPLARGTARTLVEAAVNLLGSLNSASTVPTSDL